MPPYYNMPLRAQPAYQANPLPNTFAPGSPRSSLSRVQTIDSATQLSMNNTPSPPQSFADAVSEPDADANAVQPYRYRDPMSPQPENAQVTYPQRQSGPVGFPYAPYGAPPQYGGGYPADQFWQPPPLQHRGTASTGPAGFGLPRADTFGAPPGYGFSRSDTMGSTASSTSQRNGHKYGKVTIKGKGRVIQGNSYEGHQAPAFLRENEYGDVEMEGEALLKQGDVPTSLVREFLGSRNSNVQTEHQGYSSMPPQR